MLLYMTSKIHHFVSVHVNGKSKKKVSQKKGNKRNPSNQLPGSLSSLCNIIPSNLDRGFVWNTNQYPAVIDQIKTHISRPGPDLRGHGRRLRSEFQRESFQIFSSYRLMRLPMKRCLCSVGSWFTKTYSSNHPISTSLAEHFKNNLKLEAQGESQLKFWWKIGFTQTSQQIQRFIFFEFLLVQRKKYGLCLKCGISSFWLEGSGEWYGTPLEHFQDVSTQISCWELRSFRYVFYLLGIREDQIHPNTIYFIYVNPEKSYEFLQIHHK